MPDSEFVPLPEKVGEKFGFSWSRGIPANGKQAYRDFNLPTQSILAKIPHLHVVTSEKDSDGLYRRAPIYFRYGQTWLPSLALKAVAARMKDPQYSVQGDPSKLSIQLNGKPGLKDSGTDIRAHFEIPLDPKAMLPLHFYRPDRDVEIVPIAAAFASASRLQSGEVSDFSQLQLNPLTLKDKIIIIGASANGLFDLKATPVSASYPGPLLHATAISNILTQDFLKRIPGYLQILLNVFTLVLTYFSIFLLSNIFAKVFLPIAWVGGYTAFAFYLFQKYSVAVEMAGPVILESLAIFDGLAYLVFVEHSPRSSIRKSW